MVKSVPQLIQMVKSVPIGALLSTHRTFNLNLEPGRFHRRAARLWNCPGSRLLDNSCSVGAMECPDGHVPWLQQKIQDCCFLGHFVGARVSAAYIHRILSYFGAHLCGAAKSQSACQPQALRSRAVAHAARRFYLLPRARAQQMSFTSIFLKMTT